MCERADVQRFARTRTASIRLGELGVPGFIEKRRWFNPSARTELLDQVFGEMGFGSRATPDEPDEQARDHEERPSWYPLTSPFHPFLQMPTV